MKSILLTSTALVAFAGAAVADGHAGVSFSGSATLGYNAETWTGDSDDSNDGFYADMELDVTMSATLDNGITVTATADIDELDASDSEFADVTLEIASDMASLTFGDTDTSADLHWSGVDGDTTDGFKDRDAYIDDDNADAILRGEATMAGITASLSYAVITDTNGTDIDGLQVAAVADLGGYTIVGAYQAETDGDFVNTDDSLMAVSAAGSFGGADIMVSYMMQGDTYGDAVSSLGVSASYPLGPVTVGGYYSMNTSDDATAELDAYGLEASYADGPIAVSASYDMIQDAAEGSWEIDGSYDTGLSVVVYAGINSGEEYYVGGTYDLGGGAELLVSYAAGAEDDDEVGANDYQEGTTVEVSFSF